MKFKNLMNDVPVPSLGRYRNVSFECFDCGYYRPDRRKFDPERLKKAIEILSRGQIPTGTPEEMGFMEFHDGPGCLGFYYARELEKAGLGIFVTKSTSPEELAEKVNHILATKGLPAMPPERSAVRGAMSNKSAVEAISRILKEQGAIPAIVFRQCLTVLTQEEADALSTLEKQHS